MINAVEKIRVTQKIYIVKTKSSLDEVSIEQGQVSALFSCVASELYIMLHKRVCWLYEWMKMANLEGKRVRKRSESVAANRGYTLQVLTNENGYLDLWSDGDKFLRIRIQNLTTNQQSPHVSPGASRIGEWHTLHPEPHSSLIHGSAA